MRTEGGAPSGQETAPEAQQGAQEATQQPTQPDGPPEWLGPITERMTQLQSQTSQMAEQIAGLYQQPESEPEEEEEFELYDEETGELTPEAAERIIDQRVEAMLSDRLAQRDAADALELREVAFDDLRDRIPELRDDEFATQLVREVAADLEAEGFQAMIETPVFVDLIEQRFKASRWDSHQQETSSEREVELEPAGGAAQQTKREEPDWGDRIVKAAESLRPKI